MWDESIVAINKYLAEEVIRNDLPTGPAPLLWYGHADMNTGARRASTYGALDAFFPAVLALSGDVTRARRLQVTSYVMWREAGIEPEEFDYRAWKITSPGYPLRPEIVESTYYLYKLSGDPSSYLSMGEEFWKDFVQHCRTDDAYAALKNVITKEKSDSMQSFLFAETFKYFYLLFAPPDTIDFRNVIFNTEAHPIRKFKR
jgi:glycosyl hydrolase family 47